MSRIRMSDAGHGRSVSLDLDTLLRTRLLIQANSGGGKSWAIRRLCEQAFRAVQIIVIDPEGEFASLREKYGFVLAGQGGETMADVRSAPLLAQRLLELRASAVCDLYEAFRKSPSQRRAIRNTQLCDLDRALGAGMQSHQPQPFVFPSTPPEADAAAAVDLPDVSKLPAVSQVHGGNGAAPVADSAGAGDSRLNKGERTVLLAIVQHPGGISRQALTVITGYKRTSRDEYVRRLRVAGAVSQVGALLVTTPPGVDALGREYRQGRCLKWW
jgi:hypothetical protein